MATTKITTNVIADDAITSDQLGGDLTMPGHVSLADNKEIRVGTGNDLVIKHSGSHTTLTNTTGNLTLAGDAVYIANAANSEYLAQFIADGAASLRFNNVEELATVSGGVYIPNELGIGTNSPSAALHITVADNTEFLKATITGQEHWAFKGASGSGATDYVSFGISGGTQAMVWQEDGNVVIGGSTVQGGGLLTLEGSDANMLVLHRTADTGDQGILFYDHGDHNATIYGKNGGALELRTNGNTLAMSIDSSQNTTFVGILKGPNGTSSAPTYGFTNDTDCGMYLSSTGYLGLTVAGTKSLEIGGGIIYTATNGKIRSAASAGSLELSGGGGEVGGQILLRGGAGDADIILKTSSGSTSATERMRVETDGNVAFAKNITFANGQGIDFANTSTQGGNTSVSHLFNDYEHGDFTPSHANSVTHAVSNGRYVRVGDLVYFAIQVGNSWSNITSSWQFTLDGLPFPVYEAHAAGAAFARYIDDPDNVIVYVTTNEQLHLYRSGTGSWDTLYLNELNHVSAYFYIQGTYRTT